MERWSLVALATCGWLICAQPTAGQEGSDLAVATVTSEDESVSATLRTQGMVADTFCLYCITSQDSTQFIFSEIPSCEGASLGGTEYCTRCVRGASLTLGGAGLPECDIQEWQEGVCPEEECSGVDLAPLHLAIQKGSVPRLQAFLAQYPDRVSYDAEFGLMDVEQCAEVIRVEVPPSMAERLKWTR